MSSTSAGIQVAEFVAALSRAWKKLAAYPPGHPEVMSSLELLDSRLADLRGPAGEVVLGVAANALVYGTLDITSAGAPKLAQSLYTRGIAVVRLGNEVSRSEIEIFLRLLGGGTDGRAPLWEELTSHGVTNINLQPVSYGAVNVSDGVKDKPRENEEKSLWDEVLRALLHDHQFAASGDNARAHIDSADELARMIAEYASTEAEQSVPLDVEATSGVRLTDRKEEAFHRFFFRTVGHHIASTVGVKRQNSLEQAIQLLRSLPEQLRRPLIAAIAEALSQDESSGALLRDFANELPGDEVLDALRYLSSIEKLSGHSLALLRSMTTIEGSRSEAISDDVLNDIVQLFGEDDVARFNPAEYDGVLRTLSVDIPAVPSEATSGIVAASGRVDPALNAEILCHFCDVLLDVIYDEDVTAPAGTVFRRIEGAIAPLLEAEEYDYLQRLVNRSIEITTSHAVEQVKDAARESLARISDVVVHQATGANEEQALKLRPLIGLLDVYARQSFIDKLTVEENRSRRRRLLNFIAAQGPAIVPHVVGYLGDARWYVVRNMIVLLRAVKDETSLPEIRTLARHPDLRVRMEALKSLFAFDRNVPETLLDDLFRDRDPKIGQTAVGLAGSYAIREAVGPLLRILQENDYLGANRALRMKAIRALGDIGDPHALTALRKFFASSLLPWPPKEERYAAWESLGGYPPESRKTLTEIGSKSTDARIREICSRIGSR